MRLSSPDKLASAGIQPMVGATYETDFGDGTASETNGLPRYGQNAPPVRTAGPLALLASNPEGYANLIKLASQAFLLPDPTEPTRQARRP